MKITTLLLLFALFFTNCISQDNVEFKLKADHEFDASSGITISNISNTQVENLALLGKTWGFLKYHHPHIASGNINWDYQLFRILPAFLKAANKQERNNELLKLVNSLGPVNENSNSKNEQTDDIKMQPDLGWIKNTNELGDTLSNRLIAIKNCTRTNENYYISFVKGVGNPVLDNENPYLPVKFPDAGFQLLCLYRYWNIINYFFPYKYLMDEKWDKVLNEFIPLFLTSNSREDYTLTTLNLIAKINDTHANILPNRVLESQKGPLSPPFPAIFIDEKLVITGYYSDTLGITNKVKPGDIILKINNESVEALIKKFSPFISASNRETLLRDLTRNFLLRTKGNSMVLDILRNKTKMNVIVPALYPQDFKFQHDFMGDHEGPGYYLVKKDIGYLLPSKYKNENLSKIKELFKDTRGLIIDMRCYPSDFMPFRFGEYIKPSISPFVKFTRTSLTQPGVFKFGPAVNNGSENLDKYHGKVIILVNEITQSQAEYTVMALQGSPNVKVLGSTTAGADGNVTRLKLPGGINTSFSGLGVYYPDGSETQRVGIKIDIPFKPTIEGIKAGKDELLEKALEMLGK